MNILSVLHKRFAGLGTVPLKILIGTGKHIREGHKNILLANSVSKPAVMLLKNNSTKLVILNRSKTKY